MRLAYERASSPSTAADMLLALQIIAAATLAAPPAGLPGSPPVRLPARATVQQVAETLASQLGVPIHVRAADPAVHDWPTDPQPAWDALDQLAQRMQARVQLTEQGNGVTLIPGRVGPAAVAGSAHGPFRVMVEQVTSRFDPTTGAPLTDVSLMLHWEPRVPVFRADGMPKIEQVADDLAARAGPEPTATRTATRASHHAATVRLTGVPRGASRLTRLHGTFTVTAAPRLLRVTVPDLGKPEPVQRDGVTVAVGRPVRRGERVEVTVDLTYPPPTVEFESFEAGLWLTRNRLTLIRPTGETVQPLNLDDEAGNGRARLIYRFAAGGGLETGAGWSAVVETPAPLVEFTVPFTLSDIPLP